MDFDEFDRCSPDARRQHEQVQNEIASREQRSLEAVRALAALVDQGDPLVNRHVVAALEHVAVLAQQAANAARRKRDGADATKRRGACEQNSPLNW